MYSVLVFSIKTDYVLYFISFHAKHKDSIGATASRVIYFVMCYNKYIYGLFCCKQTSGGVCPYLTRRHTKQVEQHFYSDSNHVLSLGQLMFYIFF